MRLSVLSTEYVKVPVEASQYGLDADISSDVVAMAFKSGGASPSSGDWITGSWEKIPYSGRTVYLARCLVGPATGAHALAAGDYAVWVKVTDNPEIPVLLAGNLTVF